MLAVHRLLRFSVQSVVVGLLLVAMPCGVVLAQKTETTTTTVFAAASLKTALDAAKAAYQTSTGNKVVISYAASSVLAKQIEHGAPADIFISADLAWMNYIEQAKLIKEGTRFNLLSNRLVLIAPKSSKASLKIEPGFDLAAALGSNRLAMANYNSVPAGKYGAAALEKLGVWKDVKPKVAPAANVRAALALVAEGEAPFGIVYETDAVAEPKVKVVGVFPEDTHPPIIYPIAVTAGTNNAVAAEAFINYLKSPQGQAAFTKQGFAILK